MKLLCVECRLWKQAKRSERPLAVGHCLGDGEERKKLRAADDGCDYGEPKMEYSKGAR